MSGKKLPDPNKLRETHGDAPVHVLLKGDEIQKWLSQIFELKESDELAITHQGIAGELSIFLGVKVNRRQITEAHAEWRARKLRS